MSQITELETETDFHSHISSATPSTLIVISFHTPWAAPCKQMKEILSALASTYPPASPATISFISLNAETLPDISESYDVTAVPFLVLQRDGKVLESVSGCDAGKVRGAVERHVGATGEGKNKSSLPAALATQPRPDDKVDASTSNGVSASGAATKDLSGYAPTAADPATAPEMSSTAGDNEALDQRLAELVKAAPVMLFMKGTPSSPQCGFSRQLVAMLREQGVRYGFFNILADEDVRQRMKVWADWPTFPQLWVGGELVGGLDIVKEELDSDPEFFKDYAVGKGKGGMAAPEDQKQPETASA